MKPKKVLLYCDWLLLSKWQPLSSQISSFSSSESRFLRSTEEDNMTKQPGVRHLEFLTRPGQSGFRFRTKIQENPSSN